MEQQTLAEVKTWFTAWRSTKQHREPIPQELWDAAASLCGRYPVSTVSKVLSLSYTTLKKRAKAGLLVQPAPPPASPDFIAVDLCSSSLAECCVEMEHRNGNKLRMHFTGKAELDLQSMAESFWNKNS